MTVRLLTLLLLLLAGALWATAPAAGASQGGEPAAAQGDPEEPEPIPDFWSVEEPASSSSDQASTSPGGTAPASGTLTTGPGAPASNADSTAQQRPVAGGESACDPRASLREGLHALRRAIGRRNLLVRDAGPVTFRAGSCLPGTLTLSVVEEQSGIVLWRATRELRTTDPATLRPTMTRAGRRFVKRARRGPSRVVRMRLRARLTAAAG